MTKRELAKIDQGKKLCQYIMILIIAVWAVYSILCLVLQTKFPPIIVLVVPVIVLTYMGFPWAKKTHFVLSAIVFIVFLLLLGDMIYCLIKYQAPVYLREVLEFAVLSAAHAVSIVFLCKEPVKGYLETTARQRKKAQKEKRRR